MVHELKSFSELKEYISRKRLVVVAIANKDKEETWRYVQGIFNKLEQAVKPSIEIEFVMIHYQIMGEELKSFELKQAQRSVVIKLFLDGMCIFEQEGMIGSRVDDEIVLRKGIKETLKLYSIDIKFTAV